MNILQEANQLTSEDRMSDYGHPRDNFKKIANLWQSFIRNKGAEIEISEQDVALLFSLAKIARQQDNNKRDNLTDIAGYARTIEMLNE